MPKFEPTIGTAALPDDVLRKLLAGAIARSPKSRTQIAEEMSLHVGRRISKRMLDDWTAESKERARFPLTYLAALCEATGSDELQRHVLSERLRNLLEIGEGVTEAAGSLARVQEAVRKIVEQGQKKARRAQ